MDEPLYIVRLPYSHSNNAQGSEIVDQDGKLVPMVLSFDLKARIGQPLRISVYAANPENPTRRFLYEGRCRVEVQPCGD